MKDNYDMELEIGVAVIENIYDRCLKLLAV